MLNSVLEYQAPIAQAAELLGVSERLARRMLAAYREQGAAVLAHGNRGRRPHNAVRSGWLISGLAPPAPITGSRLGGCTNKAAIKLDRQAKLETACNSCSTYGKILLP